MREEIARGAHTVWFAFRIRMVSTTSADATPIMAVPPDAAIMGALTFKEAAARGVYTHTYTRARCAHLLGMGDVDAAAMLARRDMQVLSSGELGCSNCTLFALLNVLKALQDSRAS